MSGGIDWFRWHHGSVVDPKFRLVAKRSSTSTAEVIACWAFILEEASISEERGRPGQVDFESVDLALDLEEGSAARIHAAMIERGLLSDDGSISSWDKRQPKRERDGDSSAERVRKYRERQQLEAAGEKDGVTPEDATKRHVTPSNATKRHETPRGEESRGEEKKTPPSPLRGVEPAGFAEFWSEYPRKDAKQDAVKAFAKLAPDAELLAKVLASLRVQAKSESWTKSGGQFIPLPATWLNGRRWEDQSIVAPRLASTSPTTGPDYPWWAMKGFGTLADALAAGVRRSA